MGNENKVNGKLVGVLIFFIVLSIALGAFIVYDKFIASDEVKDVEDNKESNDNKTTEQSSYEKFIASEKEKRVDKIIEKSEAEEGLSGGYEIRITASGDVYADVKADGEDKAIENELLESQVVKYFIVNVSRADVGDNRELIFIKEDGTISTISFGKLLILNEVKVNKNFGSLKNIVDVYDKVTTPATEYEPPAYGVFVKDIAGNEIDITNLILDVRN